MHVFMLHKSMSEKFIMPFAFGAQHKKARHLFIHASSNGADSRITTPHDIDLSRVRSLTVSGDAGDAISHLHKYKITRVLDLEGCSDVKDCHVQHICRIWNLRYLSLGPNITKIPKQIARLKLLETLDVSKTKVTLLPVEAIGLPCLVHLIGKFKLQGPVKTERLPKESMLETLSGFIADKDQGFLQLIGHMKKLNKVKIWCECDPEEAKHGEVIRKYIEAPMVVEDNARSLSLDFQGPLTTALDQVCKKSQEAGNTYHLSSLKILTHGSTTSSSPTVLHRFIALFRDLTKLCLSTSTLTHGLQSALGDMRCLLYLKLVVANNIDGSGGLIIGGSKFGSLLRLCLVLKAMEPPPAPVLTIQDGARPEIVSLRLICEHLVGLSGVDITRLPELKEVALHPGVAEETRQAWEAEARSHPNMPNVLAIAANDPEEKSIIIQGENGNESRNQRHRLLRGNLCGKTHKDADSQ